MPQKTSGPSPNVDTSVIAPVVAFLLTLIVLQILLDQKVVVAILNPLVSEIVSRPSTIRVYV